MDEDIRYIVNKNRRAVVCIITGCKYLASYRLYKYIPDWSKRYSDDCCIPDKYVGVAKCAPEDTWDEEFGKKLAFFKARKKRNRAINKAIEKQIKEIEKQVNNLKTLGIHPEPVWEEDYARSK